MIVIGILFFIYQSMNRNNDEDYEHDGSSSTKIRHGNL